VSSSHDIAPDQTPVLARATWLVTHQRARAKASAHGLLHCSLAAAGLTPDPQGTLPTFVVEMLVDSGPAVAELLPAILRRSGTELLTASFAGLKQKSTA
jgi:hypothetical protein